MEEGDGNMAPLGAYASHEARQAQPTTGAAASAAGEAPAFAASIPSDDVEMNTADGGDDAGQDPPPQQARPATDTAMDEEEKQADDAGEDDSTVVLHLKFLHRDRVTLRCAPTIVIADLKQLVRDAYVQAIQGDDAGSQQNEPDPATQPLRLIYKGKVLKDDQTLASYNFLNEDTVHAVFSRPSTTPAAEGTSTTTSEATRAGAGQSAGSDGSEDQDGPTNVFVFEGDGGGGMPDFSQLISSMVNSAMRGSDDAETTATIRIFPVMPQSGRENASSNSSAETTATTTSAPQSSTVHTQRGASVVPTPPIGSVLPSTVPTPTPSVPAAPTSTRSGTTQLLNQAAAMRRSIPALELAPLSRPPELSEEMYNLGNAMRESGDTYLAIHRQLQFLATRFQQENHLSVSERARLRSRVQQLIPVMENLSQLSSGVSQQLANSPYGLPSSGAQPGSQAAPAPTTTAAPQPTMSSASPPPLAQAVQNIFTEILGSAVQPGAAPTPVGQALNGLPSFLGNLVALAASPQPTASGSSQAPTRGEAGSSQMMPFRSFAPKLADFVNTNPNLIHASLDGFLRAALPIIDRHIVTCYSAGSEDFVRNGVTEVENALRLYEQAHQRVYTVQESRRSIIRLAMQELAQICMPIAPSLDARSAEVQAWLRRSCSHLFAELCEIASTPTAAEMMGLLAMQLLSGNDQSFVHSRSPLLDRVATETSSMLRRRFQLQ